MLTHHALLFDYHTAWGPSPLGYSRRGLPSISLFGSGEGLRESGAEGRKDGEGCAGGRVPYELGVKGRPIAAQG